MSDIEYLDDLSPGDRKPYQIEDWDRRLGGAAVASATWSASGGSVQRSGEIQSPTVTRVYLSGGTLGEEYLLTCAVTAVGDALLIERKSFRVRCRLT